MECFCNFIINICLILKAFRIIVLLCFELSYQKRPTFYKTLENFLGENAKFEAELVGSSQVFFLTNVTFNANSLAAVDFRMITGNKSFPLKLEVTANNVDYVPLWFYKDSFDFANLT
jgi:hypothetical protein